MRATRTFWPLRAPWPANENVSRHVRETSCLNSDQPVSTATSHCRLIHLRRASVPMNVRSVPLVSAPSWETSVRIAVEVLCPGQSDHRRTGKAITILARTQRAPRSNIDPWTLKSMRGSQPKSNQYRQRSDNPQQCARLTTPSTRTCKSAFADDNARVTGDAVGMTHITIATIDKSNTKFSVLVVRVGSGRIKNSKAKRAAKAGRN